MSDSGYGKPQTRYMRTALLTAVAVFLVTGPAHADEPLAIVIYGATGEVGSLVVREALGRGHRVFAVSRHPESIEINDPNLLAVKGDLLDRAELQ